VVRDFVDGRQVALHTGRNVPAQPMAIAFNLWFSEGGLRPASAVPRVWVEDVDWVFHARGTLLSPADVDARVRALREARVARVDHVPPAEPPTTARCDF
jgi:hypothetical protein